MSRKQLRNLKGKQIVIFGAGKDGIKLGKYLVKQKFEVLYIDNSVTEDQERKILVGSKYCVCRNPNYALELKNICIIIASRLFEEEMAQQLINMGLNLDDDFIIWTFKFIKISEK